MSQTHPPDIPRFGAHCSTSPALENAAAEVVSIGGNCLQIFSGSPRTWRNPTPHPERVRAFQAAREKHDIRPLAIHANYLINLASNDPGIRANSIQAFRGELQRGVAIGADYLVLHPGSFKGQSVPEAIGGFRENLSAAAQDLPAGRLTILLENTAGAGSILGSRLEELAVMGQEFADRIPFPVGYCLDTCHLLASGYDISTEDGLGSTLAIAEATVGLAKVPVIHTNDSKTPLSSHRDRHEHIGSGFIGREAFARILNHPKLRDKAFILETPEDEDGDHATNIETLKSLRRA
jgi:deoxyribonuclease-4